MDVCTSCLSCSKILHIWVFLDLTSESNVASLIIQLLCDFNNGKLDSERTPCLFSGQRWMRALKLGAIFVRYPPREHGSISYVRVRGCAIVGALVRPTKHNDHSQPCRYVASNFFLSLFDRFCSYYFCVRSRKTARISSGATSVVRARLRLARRTDILLGFSSTNMRFRRKLMHAFIKVQPLPSRTIPCSSGDLLSLVRSQPFLKFLLAASQQQPKLT